MLYSTIMLALATAASAIDIRFFGEAHCKNGVGLACNGMQPGGCCGGQRQDGWAALSVGAIPSNWDIYSRAYTGEGCNNRDLLNQFRNEGRTDVCHGDNRHYKSGLYRFAGKKMIRGMEMADRDVAPEECEKPNTLYFADDSSYTISDLTDTQVEELVCFYSNSSSYRAFVY
jgi:hypothetical protein